MLPSNALGSNIVLTDDNQNVLARYEYEVFGAIRNETDTTTPPARYYDPYIGRFTQRDLIGDGVNWYAYTESNPLRFIDPTDLRAVNNIERGALVFTFGYEVGEYLAGRINVEFPDGFTKAGRAPT